MIWLLATAFAQDETSADDGAAAAEIPTRERPGPLDTPDFELPEASVHTLSNGLQVVIATNSEVPLFDVRLVLNTGRITEPEGKAGLASVTMDMLDSGSGAIKAGKWKKAKPGTDTVMDAEQLARQLKQLASDIGSGASDDGASIRANGIKRNLAPTLDLWAQVLLAPTFPEAEWELMRDQRTARLKSQMEDPTQIAFRAARKLTWGDAYLGRLPTEDSLKAITTDDMRRWYAANVGPSNARIFVGGDVTADEIVPLLEERLGKWKAKKAVAPPAPPMLQEPDESVLYFIDKPGAAQSVIRAAFPVNQRTDDDYFPLWIGDSAFGGSFTARVNMNLREDKGYTYGARCPLSYRHGRGQFVCATSVKTSVTWPAFAELRKELSDLLGDRPITDDEIAYFKSSRINAIPGDFETTRDVLDEVFEIWLYGLPEDWTARQIPGIEGVTTETANAAIRKHIDGDRVLWLVVGDKATIGDGLSKAGLDVIELDRDANPL